MEIQTKKSYDTLMEMMYDRGFKGWYNKMKKEKEECINKNEDEDDEDENDEESSYVKNIMSSSLYKQIFNIDIMDENDGKLRIIYALTPKFKVSDIKKWLNIDHYFDLTIIIIRENITASNQKSIDEIKRELERDIQVFFLKELQFNIVKHYLVPKHELLTFEQSEQIEKILDMYQVKSRYQLPIILRTDPISRYYNAKSGNIMRIIRSSPTAGDYISYRCCL